MRSPSAAFSGRLLLLGLSTATSLLGCDRKAKGERGAATEEEVLVFAAASLREAFEKLEVSFEQKHPGKKVTCSFAGSQELRIQLEHGAPSDVFASADSIDMDALKEQGRVKSASTFAYNEPVAIVPKSNPANVDRFLDIPRATRIVIGGSEVPIGRYTLRIFDKVEATEPGFRKRFESNVVSRELNVRQVLAKVALGEADLGIVYRTDAKSASDRVRAIDIPPEFNVKAEYPIAVLESAQHKELARAWVAFVLSADGQKALRHAGFTPAAAEQ